MTRWLLAALATTQISAAIPSDARSFVLADRDCVAVAGETTPGAVKVQEVDSPDGVWACRRYATTLRCDRRGSGTYAVLAAIGAEAGITEFADVKTATSAMVNWTSGTYVMSRASTVRERGGIAHVVCKGKIVDVP